eukprot:m.31587 g.31587  ORF g.31587 m.31587 type:complete len:139 (+) comp8329_c0_seq2:144-560(+)
MQLKSSYLSYLLVYKSLIMMAEEMLCKNKRGNKDDEMFDNIVCSLQDIVSSEEFQNIRDNLVREHADLFEDTEENKLEYMVVFKKWSSTIEKHLETKLKQALPTFSLPKFSEMLKYSKTIFIIIIIHHLSLYLLVCFK